jgi:hypothetical protein
VNPARCEIARAIQMLPGGVFRIALSGVLPKAAVQENLMNVKIS